MKIVVLKYIWQLQELCIYNVISLGLKEMLFRKLFPCFAYLHFPV